MTPNLELLRNTAKIWQHDSSGAAAEVGELMAWAVNELDAANESERLKATEDRPRCMLCGYKTFDLAEVDGVDGCCHCASDRLAELIGRNKQLHRDRDRLDFMAKQRWPGWIGYEHDNGGYTAWPVFPEMNLRDEIDKAMELATAEAKELRV